MKKGNIETILSVVLVIGLIAWIYSLFTYPVRASIALLTNFTFFISLAGGMVVWPAIVTASNGKWMGGTEKVAKAAVIFAVPSVIILIVLWIGSPQWAPWIKDNAGHTMWLNKTFLFVRELILIALFWAAAVVFIIKRGKGEGKLWAGLLSFIYCVVFTFIGFDLVMALEPDWRSNLFGAYFFISGLYIAVAGWALLSLIYHNYDESKLKDMAKLILTFCLMTTYMMYSQLLPLWYENIPEQTKFIIQRTNYGSWALISLIVSIVVYVSPLVLLFTEWAKKTPWFLGTVSLIVLAGMWIERWWLAAAQFESTASFGVPEAGTILLFLGLFGLGYDWFYSSKYLSTLEKTNNG
ncbi:MAG TPA: hypothetical protein VHP38_09850 [Ruminiclostridium sp.]|nr:hypothetical protein [Ruminiclostridium sp.]